jgi:hypothetical protein
VISKKEDWQLTTANIYSADWVDPTRNDFGHYNVVSYRAGEEIYTGKFSDYRSGTEPHLKRDDSIQIRYNPSNPKQSFYPERHSATKRRMLLGSLGLALALIVMLVVYLNGGFK